VLDTADLDLAVRVPDLGQVLPGATGRIEIAGSVYGEPTRPRVVADFDVADVRVDSLSLRSARGAVDVDLRTSGAPARLTARLDGLTSGQTVVDSVTLGVDGSQQRHEVRLGAWLEPAGVTLVAGGALTLPSEDGSGGPSWAGQIDSLTVATAIAGAWMLTEPADLLASADSVTLSEACLRQGPTGACVAVDRDANGALLAALDVEALPLSLLPAELPEGTTLTGRADATARIDLAASGELRATAEATVNGTASALAGEDTVRFDFGGDGFEFVVDSLGARASADFVLQPVPMGAPFTVLAEGTLPGLTSIDVDPENQSIQGEARIESEDLSFLTAFATGIGELEGRLRLDATVGGTLATPQLRGGVEFTEGRVTVPDAGLDLHAIRMTGEADTDGGIALEGGARSGEGEVRIEGRTPVEPSEADPARVRIMGERFRAVATPEIQVEIAPDLEVVFDGALIRVEGEVEVPWARVELVEVPPAAVAPSSDVVIIDDEPVAPPEVDARVRVIVGDDVRFSGLGFTSLIEGDLTVREVPGSPPSVLGELRFIDGRYRAYGQDLEIGPGRIIFAGPEEDAGLDVTAIRTAQDGTEAGLEVRGSGTAPEITLTSDPAMADADVLSYILYGQPLSDGNASQQGQVAGAAATLGANVLTTRLASQVGLDDARVEGTTQDQAQLVAGKYITPSVYVSYGVGLFRPSNTFRIKYLLNSNWALQAESGDANGGDVLYQIERGR
jgi:translocation and assembly module TamB